MPRAFFDEGCEAPVSNGESPLTPMVSATIDAAALKHNLQVIRTVGAALPRHGGDQGECLWAWTGRGRASTGVGGFLRGGAGR